MSSTTQKFSRQKVIGQTQQWLKEIVIGLNLCPFAAPVVKADRIDFVIFDGEQTETHLQQLADSFEQLDASTDIETSLLIFPQAYHGFADYLDFLQLANQLLEDLNYTGTYQLASFHPEYQFDGSEADDVGNYTNRSPYPMLHLLRESSIEKAIAHYPDIDQVPDNNIKKLHDIGLDQMREKLKNL